MISNIKALDTYLAGRGGKKFKSFSGNYEIVGATFPMKLLNKRHIHEEAFRKGVDDFRRGNLDCPYNSGFLVIREWHRGFNTEYFRNLDKVKMRERERQTPYQPSTRIQYLDPR